MSGHDLESYLIGAVACNIEEIYAETESGHITFENHGADFRQSGMKPADDLEPLLERAARTTVKNDVQFYRQ
jgi:hypothetical protein